MRLLALLASLLTGQAEGAPPAPATAPVPPPRPRLRIPAILPDVAVAQARRAQRAPPPPIVRTAPPPVVRVPSPPAPPAAPPLLYGDPPPRGRPPPVRARPERPLAELVAAADYPAAARRKGLAGRTGVTLEIGADGRVAGCWVTGPSGAVDLDRATCRILRSRARFLPARDARGRPARDFHAASIAWALPAGPPAPAPPSIAPSPPAAQPPVTDFLDPPPDPSRGNPARRARPRTPLAGLIQVGDYPRAAFDARQQGDVTLGVGIDGQGRVGRCEVLRSSGSASLDAAACLIVRERARYEPARTAKGDAVPDTDAATLAWRLEGQRSSAPRVPVPIAPPPPMIVRTVPPLPVASPARARINLAALFSTDDYPAAALRAEQQGRVVFRLRVGVDGRVLDCTIATSSGSASLDAATCRILRSRARFTPARDGAGNPAVDSVEGSITWVLPAELPGSVPVPPVRAAPLAAFASYVSAGDYPIDAFRAKIEGRVAFFLLIGTDGRVRDCEIDGPRRSRTLEDATCAVLTERARFTPARDLAGAAACDVIAGELWWRLPDTLPPSPGERVAPTPPTPGARLPACPGADPPQPEG